MTLELSVNYKALTPLEQFYIIDVEERDAAPGDGQKRKRIQVTSSMKSLDRQTLHSSATSLWVEAMARRPHGSPGMLTKEQAKL